MQSKVFCIGFHKTGTTSMKVALEILGYRVTGPNGVRDPEISKNVFSMASELVQKFDAFQDNPWPVLYRELDRRYPGSKFILTLRDEDSWIRSQVRHFGQHETPMRVWIYGVGCPAGNEKAYLERFKRHNDEVVKHFADRPNDFMVMELASGDGWSKLCPFLGFEIPKELFPHVNKATYDQKPNDPRKPWTRIIQTIGRKLRT